MKFKQKPVLSTDQQSGNTEQLAKDFLLNADKPATFQSEDAVKTSNAKSSWRDVSVQKEITAFSFRIPKKDMQQLKYISKQTGMSLNTLCLMSIQTNNRKILKEIEDV